MYLQDMQFRIQVESWAWLEAKAAVIRVKAEGLTPGQKTSVGQIVTTALALWLRTGCPSKAKGKEGTIQSIDGVDYLLSAVSKKETQSVWIEMSSVERETWINAAATFGFTRIPTVWVSRIVSDYVKPLISVVP